jgi:hypothetical protein
MASIVSLSDDLLRCILDELPQQSDAIALASVSRQFNAFYPTDVTRAFAPDATPDEYIAMCEWILTRRVSSFTLAVDVATWNETAPKVLAGTPFDRITLAPNAVHAVTAKPWVPDCKTLICGFASDPRLIITTDRTSVSFHNLQTDPSSTPVSGILPDFPEVPGAEPFRSISCTGRLEGLDRLPLNSNIHILGGVLGQKEIDHLSRVETSLRLANSAIDASVKPCAFAARQLLVSINALPIVKTATCTTLAIELRGGDVYPETVPPFPNLTHVYFLGFTHDRLGAFRFAALFPNVQRSYAFDTFTPV